MGSTLQDRSQALNDAARFGDDVGDAVARIRREMSAKSVTTDHYFIMAHPVTQGEYAAYVYATGAAEPWIPASDTDTPARNPKRFVWQDGKPAKARMEQPAVLVSHFEAAQYCQWWGRQRAGTGSLPSEAQWERAARGTDDRRYPWGMRFDPTLTNTREGGLRDAEQVGQRPQGGSPQGVEDMVGNVAEWTADFDGAQAIVKGGSWDEDLVAARIAARSFRAPSLRDVTVGFRCVLKSVTKSKRKPSR